MNPAVYATVNELWTGLLAFVLVFLAPSECVQAFDVFYEVHYRDVRRFSQKYSQ